MNMKMPDITQAQVLAVVGWIVAQAVSYGLLDTQTSQLVMSTVSTLLATGVALADAWIRHGRSQIAAAAIAAPGDTKTELDKVRS